MVNYLQFPHKNEFLNDYYLCDNGMTNRGQGMEHSYTTGLNLGVKYLSYQLISMIKLIIIMITMHSSACAICNIWFHAINIGFWINNRLITHRTRHTDCVAQFPLWLLLVDLVGLRVTCSPQDPRFAGLNPAEANEVFQDVKILRTSPPGGTLSWGSRILDFRLVKEPQAWKIGL